MQPSKQRAGRCAGGASLWESAESLTKNPTCCRVVKPLEFNAKQSCPVIVSLHGAGGKGPRNDKQLKYWNRQLAEEGRRKDSPSYVVAPQAKGMWNVEYLNRIKSLIKTLPSVDMDRIYIMGHSLNLASRIAFARASMAARR